MSEETTSNMMKKKEGKVKAPKQKLRKYKAQKKGLGSTLSNTFAYQVPVALCLARKR